MKTDTEIKLQGLEALVRSLGEVEAERFISLMQREPFDYTRWQRALWASKTVAELSQRAMQCRSGQFEDSPPTRS